MGDGVFVRLVSILLRVGRCVGVGLLCVGRYVGGCVVDGVFVRLVPFHAMCGMGAQPPSRDQLKPRKPFYSDFLLPLPC